VSIKRAANRFLKANISGLLAGASVWDECIAKGAFLTTQKEDQYRYLLFSPYYPLPPEYRTIYVTDPEQIYLVGQTSNALTDEKYSDCRLLRRAPKICEVYSFSYDTAASGARINPVKNLLGVYRGDIETILFSSNKGKFNGHMEGSTKIVLPLDAGIQLGYNIKIDDALYDVQGVAHDRDFTYATCTMKVHQTTWV
jgi:hypothetical protein